MDASPLIAVLCNLQIHTCCDGRNKNTRTQPCVISAFIKTVFSLADTLIPAAIHTTSSISFKIAKSYWTAILTICTVITVIRVQHLSLLHHFIIRELLIKVLKDSQLSTIIAVYIRPFYVRRPFSYAECKD